jgi:hypothetical protein
MMSTKAAGVIEAAIAADPSFCLAHSDLGCGGRDWEQLALVYAYAVAGQSG